MVKTNGLRHSFFANHKNKNNKCLFWGQIKFNHLSKWDDELQQTSFHMCQENLSLGIFPKYSYWTCFLNCKKRRFVCVRVPKRRRTCMNLLCTNRVRALEHVVMKQATYHTWPTHEFWGDNPARFVNGARTLEQCKDQFAEPSCWKDESVKVMTLASTHFQCARRSLGDSWSLLEDMSFFQLFYSLKCGV